MLLLLLLLVSLKKSEDAGQSRFKEKEANSYSKIAAEEVKEKFPQQHAHKYRHVRLSLFYQENGQRSACASVSADFR